MQVKIRLLEQDCTKYSAEVVIIWFWFRERPRRGNDDILHHLISQTDDLAGLELHLDVVGLLVHDGLQLPHGRVHLVHLKRAKHMYNNHAPSKFRRLQSRCNV